MNAAADVNRPDPVPPPPSTPITVMGTGVPDPGDGVPGGARIPADTSLVVGARRHLEAAVLPSGARRVVLGPLAPALEAIAEHRADPKAGPVVVLASGDPGFFGITRALAERFGASSLRVLPGTSSVAAAFARVGIPWDDAVVVSAHGRDLRTAVNVCRAHPKVAVLTGPGAGPAELGRALHGLPRRLLVASDLGTPHESVTETDPAGAALRDWPATSVVVCLLVRSTGPGDTAEHPATIAGARPGPPGWALPDEAFSHRDSMVTKAEVRALVLARIGPRLGDLVWDIGAGSGSVAVECARLGAAVIAVERSADGIARIRANAATHHVEVQAVHGQAPDVLDRLAGPAADPDAVFVGGGGRDLEAIVTASIRRARRTVVVTLAALDRVPGVRRALAATGWPVDGVLLQSSRLAPLPGEVTRLAATNPVFVLWAHAPTVPAPENTGTTSTPPPPPPSEGAQQ